VELYWDVACWPSMQASGNNRRIDLAGKAALCNLAARGVMGRCATMVNRLSIHIQDQNRRFLSVPVQEAQFVQESVTVSQSPYSTPPYNTVLLMALPEGIALLVGGLEFGDFLKGYFRDCSLHRSRRPWSISIDSLRPSMSPVIRATHHLR